MEPQFFGQTDRQLFGAYHRPRGIPNPPVRAVLICPPIGHEYIRTHWCLRLLAGQLARKGVHVLRFDYSGTGDSAGSVQEIESLTHWHADIQTATDRLMQLSDSTSVMLLGLRMGAALAAETAKSSPQVNSVLAWEPVVSGCDYLQSLRELHTNMIDLWVCSVRTENSEQSEELLGSRYSRQLVNELEALNINWHALQQPHFVIDVKRRASLMHSYNNPMLKVVSSDDVDTWQDLSQLETAWLRPQTTIRIVDRTLDIFERLTRFGVLARSLQESG